MQSGLNSRRNFIATAGIFIAATTLKAAPTKFKDSDKGHGSRDKS